MGSVFDLEKRETYEKDIVMIEDTLQGLVDAKEALESANQEIIKAGTINGDRADIQSI